MNAARKMRASSYFMSGDMDSHVNLCAMRKYIRLFMRLAHIWCIKPMHVCVEPCTPCLENNRVRLRPFAVPALWMLSYE